MGWIGIRRELDYYLSVVGADRDEEGKFLIRGSIVSFMGIEGENAEIVVSDETEYFVGGRGCNLSSGLGSTSYGMRVKVF